MQGLDEVGRKQFGLVSREQAIAAGLSSAGIRWRITSGDWEKFRRGVYRFRGSTVTWSQKAMGALLAAGPGSVLSHRTAAFLFKLDGVSDKPPFMIDVSTPSTARLDLDHVRQHRVAGALPTETVRGLTATSLARTLVDLAGVLTALDLEKALDSARRSRSKLPEQLKDYVETISHRRPGLALLLELLASRASPYDSPFEVEVFKELEARGLPKPIPGFSIYDDDGKYVMKADAAWKDQKVALHMDSYYYHHHRERFERDARQRNALALLKWTNVVVTKRSLSDHGWSDTLKRLLLPP